MCLPYFFPKLDKQNRDPPLQTQLAFFQFWPGGNYEVYSRYFTLIFKQSACILVNIPLFFIIEQPQNCYLGISNAQGKSFQSSDSELESMFNLLKEQEILGAKQPCSTFSTLNSLE